MKALIIFMCVVIIAGVIIMDKSVKTKDRIAIYSDDMDAIGLFSKHEITIHYYSKYNGVWDIEVENKEGRILTAKDKNFAKAINQINSQIKKLSQTTDQ